MKINNPCKAMPYGDFLPIRGAAGGYPDGTVSKTKRWLKRSRRCWAAAKTKNTYFSSKYKSLVERRGKKKAIVALGHKILIAAYFIIKDKVEYNELGEDYLNNFRKDKLIAYYKKQIERLDPNLEFDNEEAA